MTAARLPMIAMWAGPVATSTTAASFCASSFVGAWIPILTLCCCHSHDVAKPRFARLIDVSRPLTGLSTCRYDRAAATAVFKSP